MRRQVAEGRSRDMGRDMVAGKPVRSQHCSERDRRRGTASSPRRNTQTPDCRDRALLSSIVQRRSEALWRACRKHSLAPPSHTRLAQCLNGRSGCHSKFRRPLGAACAHMCRARRRIRAEGSSEVWQRRSGGATCALQARRQCRSKEAPRRTPLTGIPDRWSATVPRTTIIRCISITFASAKSPR